MCLCLQENCQNYIRILARTGPGKLLICGTNSFRPMCRDYSVQVSLAPRNMRPDTFRGYSNVLWSISITEYH
jgi:hypothetical protein